MSDLIIFACLAVGFGYVCRLSGINFKTTKAVHVLLNAALLAQVGTVAYITKTEGVGFEVFGLLVAALHLYSTYPTWRNGAPAYTERHRFALKRHD